MSELTWRDVEYEYEGTRMVGYFCACAGVTPLPGIIAVHDAFGLTDGMMARARELASQGYAVFAADVWGERRTPTDQSGIGPLIGDMAGDRTTWMGRIGAAHVALAAQPEVDAATIGMLGYCFGGSSCLEYVRTGGDVAGVVSIHGGLDLLHDDWSGPAASARVLLCTGADDPMATGEMRDNLQSALSTAKIDWEVDLYSGTKHAFTSRELEGAPPNDLVGYNARSAARAWDSTTRFLRELFENVASAAR